ncbi:response regulator [Rhodocyclus gracilis]|uniref:response regulator n=1 Tax=Rhodocyclus gracilis TaxID=2929842 RepID=UPI0030F44912
MNDADIHNKLRKELAQSRVLLVDRHPEARNFLRMTLSAVGITSVRNAGTAHEALRQARNARFDVILADYLLDHGRDGQQLFEELRQQQLIPLASVFMIVTGERAYRRVVSVAELAPDDYLIKPFTADQLQSRLLRAMYKKKHFAEIYGHLEDDAFVDALAALESLLARSSEFALDGLRLKGEILNALGRYDEASEVYREVLAARVAPWARMGLALALRGRGELAEALVEAQALTEDFPEYLAAYDLTADLHERTGDLTAAQETLLAASGRSPDNATRQRQVGHLAVRNKDLAVAEKAFGKALDRLRGSSLRQLDDYTNLARVRIDKGDIAGARSVAADLRREFRGGKGSEAAESADVAELAALVVDSLAAGRTGDAEAAKNALNAALARHDSLANRRSTAVSQHLAVDLAHACLAQGEEARAQALLRRAAAEHHDDEGMIDRIRGVFARAGKEHLGEAMLTQVSDEIVDLNNKGVLAARSGDLDAAISMLSQAAERVANVQFLVNAAKAIFTKMNRDGWDEALAERAQGYVRRAQAKDAASPRVVSARELCQRVAKKYGVQLESAAKWKKGTDSEAE